MKPKQTNQHIKEVHHIGLQQGKQPQKPRNAPQHTHNQHNTFDAPINFTKHTCQRTVTIDTRGAAMQLLNGLPILALQLFCDK